MQWEMQTFGPKQGLSGHELESAAGLLRIPSKQSLPRRVSYFAKADTVDWNSIQQNLTEYWLKITEILPQYYGGDTSSDPLASQEPEIIGSDNGWNRIILLLDVVYGKITTNLWAGSEKPKHDDRVWVMIKFPMIENAFRKLSEVQEAAGGNDLIEEMRNALARAALQEHVNKELEKLHQWRTFELWTMRAKQPETQLPLFANE